MPTEITSRTDASSGSEFRITGRFVLVSLVLFFLVVAGVNAVMMTIAIRSFPGADARNGYEVSQAYNREIAFAKAQAERGWKAGLTLERAGQEGILRFVLDGNDGTRIGGLSIESRLKHPSSRQLDHVVSLREVSSGLYEGRVADLPRGTWEVALVARNGAGERVYEVHSRLSMKE